MTSHIGSECIGPPGILYAGENYARVSASQLCFESSQSVSSPRSAASSRVPSVKEPTFVCIERTAREYRSLNETFYSKGNKSGFSALEGRSCTPRALTRELQRESPNALELSR